MNISIMNIVRMAIRIITVMVITDTTEILRRPAGNG